MYARRTTSAVAPGTVSRCRACHKRIVRSRTSGWVDPSRGGAFDMCEADRFANHSPEA